MANGNGILDPFLPNGALPSEPKKPGGILGFLNSALNNPIVQGIATGAAFGAPGLGLVAAPIIANDRQRAQMANEAARQKLDAVERTRLAQQGVVDLIDNLSTAQTQIMPQGQQGPPQTFPPRLDATQAEIFRAQAAIDPSGTIDSIGGLFGVGAPTKPPSDLALMRALGFAETPAGFADFQNAKNSGSLDRQIQELEFEELKAAQADRIAGEKEDVATGNEAIASDLAAVRNAIKALDELDEGLLEPGGTFTQQTRQAGPAIADVARFFGADEFAQGLETDISAFDTFSKGANDIVQRIIQRQIAAGGKASVAAQNLAERSSASTAVDKAANLKILTDLEKQLVDEAKKAGVSVPGEIKTFPSEKAVRDAVTNGELQPGDRFVLPDGRTGSIGE